MKRQYGLLSRYRQATTHQEKQGGWRGLARQALRLVLAGMLLLPLAPIHADPLGIQLVGQILLTDPIPADTLWFNGNVQTPGTSFANQNNSIIDQVFYNQFDVTGAGWDINSVWTDDIFVNGPPASTNASWAILSSTLSGAPGAVVASGDAAASLTPTGYILSGGPGDLYTEYMVQVSGLDVTLGPGVYFLAVYPDDTNGNYAGIDPTLGDGAIGTPAGTGQTFYSTDGGATFSTARGDYSAGVSGAMEVPEPSTASTMLAGLLVLCIGAARRFRCVS